MNQERSHSKGKPLSRFKTNKIAGKKNQVEPTKLKQTVQIKAQLSSIHQSNPLHQPLWFWSQHSNWSYFNRGLFWGVIVSFTAVSSGIGGVALTQIDAVKQAIAQRINPNLVNLPLGDRSALAVPLNVLLVEVKSDANEMIKFSGDSTGESQTVLLLKFRPEQNYARVISIPTNSKVNISGYGQGTIKDAYRIGGIKLLSKVVNQLSGGVRIDRYISSTPEVFQQLTASGKITLGNCDSRIRNCLAKSEQVIRQQTALETIRQRLNIPSYLARFETAVAQVQPSLDTNISVPEIISLANFIKELEPDDISVNLLAGYTPGKSLKQDLTAKSASIGHNRHQKLTEIPNISHSKGQTFKSRPIAVQNTTDNPELGRQVVAYLRQQNFREVYLVGHIPLKLEQTKIILNGDRTETANYLQNILGFGSLEAKSNSPSGELTLQIGEDALYLPTNYRSYDLNSNQ